MGFGEDFILELKFGTRDSGSRVPTTKKKKSVCPNTKEEGVLGQCVCPNTEVTKSWDRAEKSWDSTRKSWDRAKKSWDRGNG